MIAFVIPAILLMFLINKILEKLKKNKNIELILKNIRAVAFANILISCISIIQKAFIINNTMNFKVIALVIVMSIVLKKVKIPPICGIFLAGIIGIIFKFSI